MRIIFTSESSASCAVIGSVQSNNLIPRVGDYVEATDKDGTVKGIVLKVDWEFVSMNGPTIRVFLK